MKKLFASLLLLGPVLTLQAGMLDNGDFAKGRDRWSGAGEVITVDAEGNKAEPSETAQNRALEVQLHASDWSVVEQRLNSARTPQETKELKLSFEIQAMSDYAPLPESPAYTTGEGTDWKTSNWYYNSYNAVFPKGESGVSVVVKLNDTYWHYMPRKVPSDGAWRTISLDIDSLKNKDHTLTFMFPPGTGTVHIRNIQQRY